ncbi:MAG: hypothetical protein FJ361_04150 [Gemmatimonadetes bacterium]|nr:hypothetical protein [Gemmatimonadota bacterium]
MAATALLCDGSAFRRDLLWESLVEAEGMVVVLAAQHAPFPMCVDDDAADASA